MVWNDTTLRQGIVQDMEDICGLGATGISGNTILFQQFTRWANIWAKFGAAIAIKAMDGWDFDDPAWTNYPSGTYPGTTNRDYVISATEKLLKIKKVGVTYDGVNYVEALPIDTNSQDYTVIREDAAADAKFNTTSPRYDPRANAIDLYPKMTAAQVSAGGKVYIEFYREPKEFATTATDTQEPGFASPFHQLISKGAAYEWAKLYNPTLAASLRLDLFGQLTRAGRVAGTGIVPEMEIWYANRYPKHNRLQTRNTSGEGADSNR